MKLSTGTLLSACTLLMHATSLAQSTTYTGEAVVAKLNVLGIVNAAIEDTGALPAGGGSLSTELLSFNIPSLVSLNLLSASTDGANGETDSAASAVQVSLTVSGISITASVLTSNATATCAPAVSGSSTIANLKVNGLSVRVTGAPNQTVPLLVGSLVLNEQVSSVVNTPSTSSADMLVNALHLRVLGAADVILSSSHAAVACSKGGPDQ